LRQTFGPIVLHLGLMEYQALAKSIDQKEVDDDVKKIKEDMKLPLKAMETGFGVDDVDLGQGSR